MAKMHSFYTLGDNLTRLVNDHLSSGFFHTVSEILTDGLGTRNNDILKAFFKGEMKFVGDTRDDSMELVSTDTTDLTNLLDGWVTMARENGNEIYDLSIINESSNKHFKELFKIFTIDEVRELLSKSILETEHWTVYKQPPLHDVKHGVFLQDGTFVECGFEQHYDLYNALYWLGLASDRNWSNDTKCIHISSKTASGMVASCISHYGLYKSKGIKPTIEQLQAIYDWREQFNTFYRERKGSLINALRNYIIDEEDRGSKYGNLVFLDRFYDVSVPKYSNMPLKGKYAVRTSPNKSIAGILTSHFDVTIENHLEVVESITNDWEQLDDSFKKFNELHMFSQEQIDGDVGVCHYVGKGMFEYAIGERHDIVGGKKTYGTISNEHYDYLRTLSRTLFNDLGEQIQIEFIISGDTVYIVQLRTLKIPTTETTHVPKDVLGSGKSFNSGNEVVDLVDCIIVDSDVESKDCIGKKAIIVREDIAFSHALALSRMLNIPSVYDVGDLELPHRFRINTENKIGYIISV